MRLIQSSLFVLLFVALAGVSYAQIKVIAPNGDVGIGLDTPEAKLSVKSNSSATRVLQIVSSSDTEIVKLNEAANGAGLFQFNNASGQGRVVLNPQGKSYLNGGKFGIAESNPIEKFHVNGNAYKTEGGDLWEIPSDRKLKKNIDKYGNGLDIVMGIKTVEYDYNGKAGTVNGEHQIGVVAQELEEVAPFMVNEREYIKTDMDEFGNEVVLSTESIKTVNASALKWILVNAIQDQQKQIEDKDAQIDELEERLARLEEVIDGIGYQDGINQTEVNLTGYDVASLAQNQPNPFSGTTMIKYVVPTKTNSASIRIMDASGKLIKTVALDHLGEGNLTVNAMDIPSGSYSYQLLLDGIIVETKQMILAR